MDLPDHAHYYHAPATYSDGTVSVIVDESYAASVPGNTDNAYFELMQGSTVIASTQSFRVRVLKDARDGKSVPESYDSAIQEAIDNANAAAEEAREAAGGTPPPAKLGFGYGTCTTAEATKAKVSSISNYTLAAGGIVAIRFAHAVPAGSTLNITSKGAKAIYHDGAAIADGIIKAGDTATFVYSGQYHLVSIDRSNIADGSVTTDKLADGAVTLDKINYADVSILRSVWLVAADSQTDQALIALGFPHSQLTPAEMADGNEYANSTLRLCWISGTTLETAPISFYGNLQTQAVTIYAKGSSSMASGILGSDTSWTITALPTDVDGVSF